MGLARNFSIFHSISDDYYSLYGCLASGRGSYFISNDQLGDYREHLPHTLKPILQQWQKSRQVAIVRNQDCIKLQVGNSSACYYGVILYVV